jgi:hypothetical protein
VLILGERRLYSAADAVAVLAVLALLPSAATALNRNPEIRAIDANPAAVSGCFTDDSQTDFEAGTRMAAT